ncbi:hypothetical protein Tco_0417324 [Tanacetum coccineum]
MESRNTNVHKGPNNPKVDKSNSGHKGKQSTNQFVVLVDYDEGKGKNLNTEQMNEERMIDKGEIEEDMEDVMEDKNGTYMLVNEIEGMADGNDSIHQ